MSYQLLWGDLHNHCSVGLFHYAKGSLERAIDIARSHLDFFAFTGHAHWHDMPEMPGDSHLLWREGFDHHSQQWPRTRELIAEANQDGKFVAFLGYEWHSSAFGDRSVLFPTDEGDLYLPDHVGALTQFARSSGAILVPHHIAYRSGAPGRGVTWEGVDEDVSPIIEIYSEHGGSERDRGPWPYVRHTLGPRTTRNALQYALAHGRRFGVVASTDDHFGCPGAYGEGLAGVYAEEKTRAAIWDALWARRTYGVTGDRIELGFWVNDAMMGSVIPAAGGRHIRVEASGWDDLAMVEVLRNNRVVHRHFPEDKAGACDPLAGRVKCRIEFGWGPWTALGCPRTADWTMQASITGGRLLRYMPCFQSGPFDEERRNRVTRFGPKACRWQSYTAREGAFAETPTNAVVLEIEGDASSVLALGVESPASFGLRLPLGELAQSSAIEFTGPFPSEAILVHRLVPESMSATSFEFEDDGDGEDFYYARVTQTNGHMAWSSPVWVG